MSDERDDREDERDLTPEEEQDQDAPPLSEHEGGGIGLTEEFARIESEIEEEVGRTDLGADADAEDEEAPRQARFDDLDSTDWVAPVDVPRAPEPEGAEAGEAPGGTDEDAAAEETDLDGGEADPPQGLPNEADEDPDRDDAEEADPPTDDAAASSEAPALEHTVVRAAPPPPPPAGARPLPPGIGGRGDWAGADVEAKPPGLWWRFLTASVLIVASTATAVALSLLLFLTDVAGGLDPIPGLRDKLTVVEPGEPQTILILGSDDRADTPGDRGRSDTTMLLRVDAQSQVLSLFSLPRDLKVEIPGYGTDKLNAAFTLGGAPLTTETVQKLTDLKINHVVNVDFQGFADAVDAIGCVYIDVDRDYFNDNSATTEPYATIDVNAGYQRLCGLNALDYVRYRHFDTDIVRGARQQDFLSEARQRVPPSEVLPIIGGDTGSKLLDIFTKYTDSDLGEGDAGEVINILKSFINVIDVPVKEVHFNGTLGPVYVTASAKQIDKAVEDFLGEEDSAGPRGGENANEDPTPEEKSKEKKSKGEGGDPTEGANVIDIDDTYAGFGSTSARRLKFPVYIPEKVVPGSLYEDDSRQYEIKDTEDEKQDAYKMVISLTDPAMNVEYYGVQGTTWETPPILENPSETHTIDGRDYDYYYEGDRLGMVAFHDDLGNSYWVKNTLLQTIDEPEMIAIATSMDEKHG